MGDNPTAGGAGDVSWTLTEILTRPEFKSENGPSLIYASIPGPELVKNAIKAGVGKTVDGYAGAKVDDRYAPPVLISGNVESIAYGDRMPKWKRLYGLDRVHIIVTQKRKPYHRKSILQGWD